MIAGVLFVVWIALVLWLLLAGKRDEPTSLADLGVTVEGCSEPPPRIILIRTVDPTGKTVEEIVHELGNPPRDIEL